MNENILFKKNYGYTFRLGKYISEGFGIALKGMPLFLLFSFVFALITLILSFVPVLGTLLLLPTLSAGYYIAADKINKGEKLHFSHFFEGFKIYKSISLISLTSYIIIFFAFLTALYLLIENATIIGVISWFGGLKERMENFSDLPTKEILICIFFVMLVPIVCFAVFSLSVPFLLFEEKDFWEAMKMSRSITWKKILFFVLIFIIGAILYCGVQLGVYYIALKVFSQTEARMSWSSLLLPNSLVLGGVALLMGLQFLATFLAYCLLPFFHCIIYCIYKDLISDNDIDKDYLEVE